MKVALSVFVCISFLTMDAAAARRSKTDTQLGKFMGQEVARSNSSTGELTLGSVLNVITIIMNSYQAYKEFDKRSRDGLDLITNEHLNAVAAEWKTFTEKQPAQKLAEVLKTDPFYTVRAAVKTLEEIERVCVPSESFFANLFVNWPTHLGQKIWNFNSKTSEYEKKQAVVHGARAIIADVTTNVRDSFAAAMKMNCPLFEDAAKMRLAEANALIVEWEKTAKHSWFMMYQQRYVFHDFKLPFTPKTEYVWDRSCEPEIPDLKTVMINDEMVTEAQGLTLDDVHFLNETSIRIEDLLGQAEVFMKDLHDYCEIPRLSAQPDLDEDMKRVLTCDPYLKQSGRIQTLESYVGVVVKALDHWLMYLATDVMTIKSLFNVVGNPIDEIAVAITWVALRLAMGADTTETCIKAAEAIKGDRVISQEDFQFAFPLQEEELITPQEESVGTEEK